jgi:hypothetical protein
LNFFVVVVKRENESEREKKIRARMREENILTNEKKRERVQEKEKIV